MRRRSARIAARLGPPAGLGMVLGLIGPFGTFDLLPPLPRLVYWLAVVSLNWLLADAILRRVGAMAEGVLPAPRLLVPLAGALVAAFPATGIVTLANGLSGIGWPDDVPRLFGQVLLLLAAIALPVYAWEDMQERVSAGPDPSPADPPETMDTPLPQPDGPSLFAARLPGPLNGSLICLEMQDHYLIVRHTGGSVMILCRMDDAARELDGLGQRVHRSWWVASKAVAGAEREGQRLFLRLTDDRRVPVGRSYRNALREAGWL